jgi:hypothetical protein
MNDYYHAALYRAWGELIETAGWLLIVAGVLITLFCWMVALVHPTLLYLADRLRKAEHAVEPRVPVIGNRANTFPYIRK